ncbi:hypothetical protein BH11VER1_BH11VER1_22300 [soil metagenome]
MFYQLEIQARIDPDCEIALRHLQLLDSWKKAPSPWRLLRPPAVPEIKPDDYGVETDVARFVKIKISGELTYQIRHSIYDADDSLWIKFQPTTENYQVLVSDVIPMLIEGFGAYVVSLRDARFDRIDLEKAMAKNDEPNDTSSIAPKFRSEIRRVGPIAFYDQDLCLKAFGLSLSEAAEKLQGVAEECQLINGGLYIIGSKSILELDEADKLCIKLSAAMRKKPWYQFWK